MNLFGRIFGNQGAVFRTLETRLYGTQTVKSQEREAVFEPYCYYWHFEISLNRIDLFA